ncbi:FAD-dependent oxidoreductase [Patescibacteria group bacterium]|nr:FAD-dependent oxidoreductase [Patescibacteria group bacterium]
MEKKICDSDILNPRIDTGVDRGKTVDVKINGHTVRGYEGETIAAVLALSGLRTLRHTHRHHDPRGLYCCMGTCHNCLVTVNGRPNVRACVTLIEQSQEIVLQDGFGRLDADAPIPNPGKLFRQKVQILVIGGGPAGLSAAISAAQSGAEVLIIDENLQLGGQIYRQLPKTFQIKDPDVFGADFLDGRALLKHAANIDDRITTWTDTSVWGVFEDRQIAVMRNNQMILIDAQAIIVATGTYERPFPVPGWTLPGVMTVGGAQLLIKSQQIRPGQRVLLAGTGPLQLVVANQMLEAGMEVVAIADTASIRIPTRYLVKLFSRFDLLKQGLKYLFRLRKAGVKMLFSHALKAVEGNDKVKRAALCKVDSRSNPVDRTSHMFDVDTVCIGYGLIPNTWITRLLDCRHVYRQMVGGWVPVFNKNMELSQTGIFAAGDGAGVAGVMSARSQGSIAGLNAAAHCGVITKEQALKSSQPYCKELSSLHKFRFAIDRMYAIQPALYANITDDTIVCRCEEITAGEIRHAIRNGTTNPNDIKKRTRAGMGYCQGMNCLPTIVMILVMEFHVKPEDIKIMNPRPPVRPIPLNLLMADFVEDFK